MWFWFAGSKVYQAADRNNGYNDVKAVSTLVNGGETGLAERKMAYKEAEGIFQ